MAHIVNLVSKIILWQFDTKRKTKKKSVNTKEEDKPGNGTEQAEQDDEDITSLAEGLEREDQEVANDEDDDLNKNIAVDLEEIEDAMKDEILEVRKKVKPVQCVLLKVRL